MTLMKSQRCGVSINTEHKNTRYCSDCVKFRRNERRYDRKYNTLDTPMKRIAEISKHGLHYHMAKEEYRRKEG